MSFPSWFNRRPGRARVAFSPLRVESLEPRLAPAFDLNLVIDSPTVNVTRTEAAGTATYTASAIGATLNWADINTDMAAGKSVVVTSGSGGTQTGNITNTSSMLLGIDNAAGTMLTIQSGTGNNLVGNIDFGKVAFKSDNTTVVLTAANSLTVGSLDTQDSLQIVRALLTGTAGTLTVGLVRASSLGLVGGAGMGTDAAPVESQATNLEAQTDSGNIFIRNKISVVIGGVSPGLTGLKVATAGDITLATTTGSITANESVTTPGGKIALGAGANLTIIPTAKVTTSGTGTILLGVNGGTASFSGSSLSAAGATVSGSAANDVFTFSPSATTPITINAGDGDNTVNLDLTGFTGSTLQLTDTFTATASFSTAKSVTVASVTQLNVTNGTFDVLFDLSKAKLGGVAFGNGSASADAAQMFVNDAKTDLRFTAAQAGGAFTDYFSMNLGGAKSASFTGSSDKTNFELVETVGGLPTFSGTALNSHDDATDTTMVPAGTFTVANVGLNWKGGATGNDTLKLSLTTNHNVTYFADTTNTKGGNAEIASVARMSFDGLAEVKFALNLDSMVANVSKLVADATLLTKTQNVTVEDDATKNDKTNQITGDGSFTTAKFGGFALLTVRGGTRGQFVTLNALDDADTALGGVTLSGDNASGSDTAGDQLTVNALLPGRQVSLIGGQGNDLFVIVPGLIDVRGDAGANQLLVKGNAETTSRTITLTSAQINGGTNYNITYAATGGTFNNGVALLTGSGNDVITINSLAAFTTVNTGDGADKITVVGDKALKQLIVGGLTIDGGAGVNSLAVSDAKNTIGDNNDITLSSLTGTGWKINLFTTGGKWGQLAFQAGSGNDLIRVLQFGTTSTVVEGSGGNDVFRVFVGVNNLPAGLQIDGGAGANRHQTLDQTGGALIRNLTPNSANGYTQISYLPGQVTTYRYFNINETLGINPATNYIAALYRHIIGRSPTSQETAAQVGLLNAQGRLALVRSLETSLAGRTKLVYGWFQLFFGQTPTPAQASPFVAALRRGLSEESTLGWLLGSASLPLMPGFRSRLVTSYYRDLLGRAPTALELQSSVNSTQQLQTIREVIEIGEAFYLTGV